MSHAVSAEVKVGGAPLTLRFGQEEGKRRCNACLQPLCPHIQALR